MTPALRDARPSRGAHLLLRAGRSDGGSADALRGVQAVTLLFVVLLAGACGPGPDADADAAAVPVDPTPTDPRALYDGFIDCPDLPDATDAAVPDDMVVPEGAVLTEITELGPLAQANGFIDQTPVDLIETYGDDDTLVYLEDEGFEAEILIDRGGSRTYIKATVRCRTGSGLILLTSAGGQVGALPIPGQRVGTPATETTPDPE